MTGAASGPHGNEARASIFVHLNLDEAADLCEAEARLSKLTEAIAGMFEAVKGFKQVSAGYHQKHFDWARPAGGVEMGKLVEFAPVKIKPKMRGTVLNGKDMLRRRLGGSGRKFAGYGGSAGSTASDDGNGRPLSASRWSDTDMQLSETSPIRSGPTRSPTGVAAWESLDRGRPSRRPSSRGGKTFLLAPIPREGTPRRSGGQHHATRSLDGGVEMY